MSERWDYEQDEAEAAYREELLDELGPQWAEEHVADVFFNGRPVRRGENIYGLSVRQGASLHTKTLSGISPPSGCSRIMWRTRI